MRILAMALALAMLPVPAMAGAPDIFMATLPDKASGFRDLAECQKALGDPVKATAGRQAPRGSLLNRTNGNMSRCEMFDGVAVIVVYPRGHGRMTPHRDGTRR